MTGSSRSSDGLDPRRRRALFRAWRRGTRELDLLLGPFADAHIGDLGDHDLADFEALLDAPEGDVFAWLTKREPVAPEHATAVFRAILSFHAARHEQD
jgi:antitoxin CptB